MEITSHGREAESNRLSSGRLDIAELAESHEYRLDGQSIDRVGSCW